MSEPDSGLRARLVQAGVDLLTAEGVQALSLREIARRAGVSHGAPRRYFPTHLELLSAIARRGFAELADRAGTALHDAPDDPRARLRALARGYLAFARDEPGMYGLMFRHDLLESGTLGLRGSSLPLFGLLTGEVTALRPAPPSGAPPHVVAGALWANLHGIAQLRAWGSLALATGTDDTDALLRAALDAHLGPERA